MIPTIKPLASIALLVTAVTAACGEDTTSTPAADDSGTLDAAASDAPSAPQDGARPEDAAAADAASPGDAALSDATPATDAPSTAPPLQLFMDPAGDDANDGLSLATPVLTLSRVHAILVDLAPDREVEVRIAPGTYRGQTVVWRHTMPGHRIRFMPRDDDRTRPVFDGCLASGDCPGGTWLTLRHTGGEETNLHFEYIRVQRYGTAISLNGDRNAEAASNGSNRIYGCYFDRIGNVFEPSLAPSTAAVRLVNSDDNEIANNHFVDVINTTSGGLIHAIYVAHMSDRNRIERNRFARSTGDPVRLRDYSNGNVVNDNRFIKVGTTAGYTDWYCDHDARSDCTKPAPECPSWNNQFRDNTLDGDWSCGPLGVWHYFQDETTTGCSPPAAGAHRVRTSGNVQTTTPCSML